MAKSTQGPAQTLLIEDALKKMIYRDGSQSVKREKEAGLVPMGTDSVFGNFPDGYGVDRGKSCSYLLDHPVT